jgi:tetratricopeptide (TPR) repeat protein
MPWVLAEFLLKGIFLALLIYTALVIPDGRAAGLVGLWLAGGVVIGLSVAAWQQLRQGIRAHGNWIAYWLFLLLESPRQVYAGTILGLLLGVFAVQPEGIHRWLLPMFVGVGVALGIGLAALRMVKQRWYRFAIGLAAGAALVAGCLILLQTFPDVVPERNRRAFGFYILLGLPFFYLLTFVGEVEESEVETAAWCAALALGLWLCGIVSGIPSLIFLVPITIYYVYSTRILHGLRVFKHTLRGISYARVGRPAAALAALRRAIALDQQNTLARSALWDVHRRLSSQALANDDALIELIDPDMCLDRIAQLLSEPPTEKKLTEANNLLQLIERRQKTAPPAVLYWQAVAAVHGKELNLAAAKLRQLLDPTAWPKEDRHRDQVLLPAWQLALYQHPTLAKQFGELEVAKPGRRAEAIRAVEQFLSEQREEPNAWGLKRILYAGLRESELGSGPAEFIDAPFVEQLGLALIDDPHRCQRGAEYLAIAARGLPAEAPRLLAQAADALDKTGDRNAAQQMRLRAVEAGRHLGHRQLSDAGRLAYFTTLKRLAEEESLSGNLDAAVHHWQLYSEWERSGIDTLRLIADLHERRRDVLAAIKTVEHGLLYNQSDPDLLQRRDKYYYSLLPEQLRAAPDNLRSLVNVDYCLAKAYQVLARPDADADLLDWAKHLSDLALVLQPAGIPTRVLAARLALRLGDRAKALGLLEDVREQKPEKFATNKDQEDWWFACRLLGDLYLNELDRPDLAIGAFQDYRKSPKSGADTLFKLGQACERTGQTARAIKFFEQVTGYDNHPLAADAHAGISRLKR